MNTQKVVESIKISYAGMVLVKFFTEKTIIAQPTEYGIEDVERYSIL